MRHFLPIETPEFEPKEPCDSCGESFTIDFIIYCDCGGVYCVFCYHKHEKICEEHTGDK